MQLKAASYANRNMQRAHQHSVALHGCGAATKHDEGELSVTDAAVRRRTHVGRRPHDRGGETSRSSADTCVGCQPRR